MLHEDVLRDELTRLADEWDHFYRTGRHRPADGTWGAMRALRWVLSETDEGPVEYWRAVNAAATQRR